MVLVIALRNDNINGKLLTFAGPRAWTTQEVYKNPPPLLMTNNLLLLFHTLGLFLLNNLEDSAMFLLFYHRALEIFLTSYIHMLQELENSCF